MAGYIPDKKHYIPDKKHCFEMLEVKEQTATTITMGAWPGASARLGYHHTYLA